VSVLKRGVECLVGAYCGHAVLTDKIGKYFCPFGVCFKKQESQR
jgi:hypothetical protein